MHDGFRDSPRASVVRLLTLVVALGGVGSACGGHLGGGAGATGTGGAGDTNDPGGAGGEGGTVGAVGAVDAGDGPFGEPACPSTVASGGTCTPTDQQFCYKTCGPEMTGVKSESCRSSGLYAEMDGCSYDPRRDYSCYRIPVEPDSACAAVPTPQAGTACDLPPCRPCNSRGGTVRGEYFTAAGADTIGWCVCQPPDPTGKRTWSCSNAPTWPCPLGSGC